MTVQPYAFDTVHIYTTVCSSGICGIMMIQLVNHPADHQQLTRSLSLESSSGCSASGWITCCSIAIQNYTNTHAEEELQRTEKLTGCKSDAFENHAEPNVCLYLFGSDHSVPSSTSRTYLLPCLGLIISKIVASSFMGVANLMENNWVWVISCHIKIIVLWI